MWTDRLMMWALAFALAFFPPISLVHEAQALTASQRLIIQYNVPVAIAPSGFTGVLDVPSIPAVVTAYSPSHCPSTSYTGNLVDVYDLASASIKATLNCSAGGVLGVTVGSTWTLAQVKSNCVVATLDCFAVSLYDISGANSCSGPCNITGLVPGNTALSTAPFLVLADGSASCGNSSSTFFANAGTFCFQTNIGGGGIVAMITPAITSAVNQPLSVLITYSTFNLGIQGLLVQNTAGNVVVASDIGGASADAGAFAGVGVVTTPAVENQWHSLFVSLAASPSLQVDNLTPNTSSAGTNGLVAGDKLDLLGTGGSGGLLGFAGDMYFFKTTAISTVQSAVYVVEKSYYGGGMP